MGEITDALRASLRELAQADARLYRGLQQELADPTHILWGSDLPFVYGARLQEEVDHWEEYNGFDADERMAVEQLNALQLFPRFGSTAGASLQP